MALQPVGHSPVGFSKAGQWLACPGSVEAQRGLPNASTPAAERGTRLHFVAAQALEQRSLAPLEGLDEDDYACVEQFVVYVFDVLARTNGELLIEQPFHLVHLHELLYGTADAVILWQEGGVWHAEVIDLKTGWGEVDERSEDGRVNVQCGGYLLGGLQVATAAGKNVQHMAVTIVQPNRGGVKRTPVTRRELATLAADLVEGVERALAPGAPRVAGEHCEFCLAAATCPALKAAALREVLEGFGPEDDDAVGGVALAAKAVDDATTEADLLRALAVVPLVKMWLKAVNAEAFRRLNDGLPLTGWKLVAKQARRKWLNEGQAYQRLLGAGLEEDAVGEFKLKTPAQIEKLAKKAKVEIDLLALAPAKSSGATMAPVSDKREALKPGAAMFEDETEED